MDGYEYEQKCADLLKVKGFSNITVTPGSGDQGIDIIAHKSGAKYGVQCKYYTGTVGNKAVQEAYAGAAYYGCARAMVITNSTLSKAAIKLAKELNVDVWEHIDAVYLYENSKKAKVSYERLTQKEKEALQIEKIEEYLQEKYRTFHIKYPVDERKDSEIRKYVARIREQVRHYGSSWEQKNDMLYQQASRLSFSSWRDPVLTPIKNSHREHTRTFGGQLKSILDEANREAEHYISSKISVNSIIALADMIEYIYNAGTDIRVTINLESSIFSPAYAREEHEIAKFTWPEKYSRIAYKWRTIKKELPSDPEQEDYRREQLAKARVQKQLDNAKDKLKKAMEDLEEAEVYIKTVPQTLTEKKAELEVMMDSKPQKITALQVAYHDKDTKLKEELRVAQAKVLDLEAEKKAESEKLDRLFVLAFRKKETARRRINDLDTEITELKQFCEKTTQEILSTKDTYQSEINKLENEVNSLRSQIKDIEEKLKNYKAVVNGKQQEVKEIESEISFHELCLQDFHKRFLLENYRSIITA